MKDAEFKKLETDFVKTQKAGGGSNEAQKVNKAYQMEWRRRFHAKGGKIDGVLDGFQEQRGKLGLSHSKAAKKAKPSKPAKKSKAKGRRG